MTIALCLNCGQRRFGAITACPACGVESSGHFGLDITFSDHRISWSNIESFGDIIRTIRQAVRQEELAHWAFLMHVSDNYPALLTVEPPSDIVARASAVLAELDLPRIELELKAPGEPPTPGESSCAMMLTLIAAGAAIVAVGLGIETYDLAWYTDARSILVVGFGVILVAGGLRGIRRALAAKGRAEEAL